MILIIRLEDLNPNIKSAYLADEIKGMGIDYQYNGIYGYINDKEVCVVDFNKYFRLDNRYSSYEIFCNPTQIIIQFI